LIFGGKKKDNVTVLSDMADKTRRYEALVKAYHGDIFRYAYWLVGDHAVAEDITQEAFLRAWKSLDSLNELSKAKSWLITILRRENARRFERKQFNLVDIDDHQVVDDQAVSTEDTMEQQLIQRQMMKLSAEYREPLLLQVVGGFSGEEISQILGLNKNTVMTRLFRARNQLKDNLETT
jgi:RNA polymerase sigma-70 factor (ECF subfamily)